MYIDPKTVTSPKHSWKLHEIIYNTGSGGWSAAEGEWENEPALGLRWNGSDDDKSRGTPQSFGNPTWMIIPRQLVDTIREKIKEIKKAEYFEIQLTKPDGYANAARKVEVILSPDMIKNLAGDKLVFDLPSNELVNCQMEREYRCVLNTLDNLCGIFHDGKWEADFYNTAHPTHKVMSDEEVFAEVRMHLEESITKKCKQLIASLS